MILAFKKRFKKEEKRRPKVGLALSGGSTYGIAHLGALKALTEQGIPIDCISGTSAGALVAGCFAFGMPIEQMITITRDLNWRKLSRFGYSRLGLHTNKPMGAFITDQLGDVDIKDAKIPLAIVATNIETHEMVSLCSGSMHEAIRASTCIPGIFTPVEIDGALLVDGYLTENLPLTPLKEMGADITIGVDLSSSPSHYRPKNVFDVLAASFAILADQRDAHRAKADCRIEPDLASFDGSKFKDVEELIDAGYTAAMRAVPALKERIANFGVVEKKSLLQKIFPFAPRAS